MEHENPYSVSPSGMGRPPVPFGPAPWPEQGGVPFEGSMRYEDFLMAQRLHGGWRQSLAVKTAVFLAALIVTFWLVITGPRWTPGLLVVSVALPVLVVTVLALRRLRIQQNWGASKLNGQPVLGHVSDAGVELRLPILESRLTWQAYMGYRCDDQLLLLYQQPALFNMFPRRFFRDDADWKACCELAEQHLPPR